MKKFALIGIGLVAGFGAATFALPEAKGANDTSAYGQLDLFSDAFERVRANYVRPVKDSELVDAAIQGMVSNLDPHSSYMDAKMYGDMQITTKGQFGGCRHRSHPGRRRDQGDLADRRHTSVPRRHQDQRPHHRHRRQLHAGPAAQ
jgi:hypothetical protein